MKTDQGRTARAPADTDWNRFWYGVGHGAEGIKTSALASVILFYFSQVLGLDPRLAGFALLLAVVTDGTVDMLVGAWSDSFHSRWGRRHPFMYASIIPFALSFALIFMPPHGLGQWGLFAWLLIGALVARNAMAMFIVPYYALGVELSSDHDARTMITAYRAVFNFLGMGLVFVVGAILFAPSARYPNGQLDPAHYPLYGGLLAVIMLAMTLGCTWGTHNAIPHLPVARPEDRFDLRGMVGDVIRALRTRAYATLFFGLFIWAIGIVIIRTMEIYMATYFWRLDHSLVFLLPLTSAGASLVGTPIWAMASRHIGKKYAMILSILTGLAAYVLLIMAKITGVFSAETPHYVAIVFGSIFVAALLASASVVMGGSMLADVADDFHYRTGLRREGILSGGTAFITKCSTGFAGQLGGLIVAAVHLRPKADPHTVPASVSDHLALLGLGSYVALGLLGAAVFWLYPLTRKRLAQIQAALGEHAEPDLAITIPG